MPTFEVWDVVKVPFPYTDRPVRERRPALVVATGDAEKQGLVWVLMITSAENRGWSGDVLISDITSSGLPVASVVRTAKIATIEVKESERIGSLPSRDRAAVGTIVRDLLEGILQP